MSLPEAVREGAGSDSAAGLMQISKRSLHVTSSSTRKLIGAR